MAIIGEMQKKHERGFVRFQDGVLISEFQSGSDLVKGLVDGKF